MTNMVRCIDRERDARWNVRTKYQDYLTRLLYSTIIKYKGCGEAKMGMWEEVKHIWLSLPYYCGIRKTYNKKTI